MYEGSSTRATSPGSRRVRLTRSSPCWLPSVIRVCSRVAVIPLARAYSVTAWMRAPTPRVRTYWNACALSFSRISFTISRNWATGNVSGLGWPGAKEMIPGLSMSALIRRIAEKRMPRAAAEKRVSWAAIGGGVYPLGISPGHDLPDASEAERDPRGRKLRGRGVFRALGVAERGSRRGAPRLVRPDDHDLGGLDERRHDLAPLEPHFPSGCTGD